MDEFQNKAGTALLIVGAVAAVPCGVAIAAGFGATGVVAGSAAAAWQAAIGNVAAGSVFATLQSLAMTGTLATGATTGAAAAVAGTAMKMKAKRNSTCGDNQNDEEEDEEGGNDQGGEINTKEDMCTAFPAQTNDVQSVEIKNEQVSPSVSKNQSREQ